MKKVMYILMICFTTVAVNAAMDWDIYNDATIEDGDVYGTVNIYDTPPDQTVVTMTGGNIDYCNVYNTAKFYFESGDIFLLSSHNQSNITVSTGSLPAGPDVFEMYDNSEIHLQNGNDYTTIQIFDNAVLHIYGYAFEYDPTITGTNSVTGKWENDVSFFIALRSGHDPYTQVILHEIPEPLTVILLGFGGFFIKK